VIALKILVIGALIVAAVLNTLAMAESEYLRAMNSRYNITNGSKLDDCSTCHSGIWDRNSYGVQLEAAGASQDIEAAFAATDTLDADFDGARNWVELVNGTWPSDPNDTVPVDEATWGRIKALFN
jgi:hypothetical protein